VFRKEIVFLSILGTMYFLGILFFGGFIMSHVKHLFMSCFFALSTVGLQAAESKPETPSATETPVTITLTQTGNPSWKTFYKVPVEVSITNNTNEDLFCCAPYISGVSIWNSSTINQKLANICDIVGSLCFKATILTFIAHSTAILLDLPLAYQDIHLARFVAPMLNHVPELFVAGVFNKLLEIGIFIGGTRKGCIKPHETVSINGYISTTDIQKIRNSEKSNGGNVWQFIPLA
jgi:hypothetical protein